jgi:selenide,water dikinase
LAGFETNDDAAVYRLSEDVAALMTVDFFTPIVDDPYDFGRITAANSLSDIYAMGGIPLTAMNLVAISCKLGPSVVAEILRGASDVCKEAGVVIVGGHTIDDAEPKFGLSVMGTAHPERVWRNAGAQPKDIIVLTKPLGTGILGTALKQEVLSAEDAAEAIEVMATLNKTAMEAALGLKVHACTDITGFGLVGHVHEMAQASNVDAEIALDVVPVFDRVPDLAKDGVIPGRTADIIDWAEDFVSFDDTYSEAEQKLWHSIVCDPQTSGGLLFAMPLEDAAIYLDRLDGNAYAIGKFRKGDGAVRFV